MDHFIKEALNACKKHYAVMDVKLRDYDKQLADLAEPKYAGEYRARQVYSIKTDRAAYCKEQAPILRAELAGIFQAERDRLTQGIAGKLPNQEQAAILSVLRNRKNITQSEFDVYAEKVKGVYMAEKELAEIAEDRDLVPPPFVDLDAQLERLAEIEFQFRDVSNYTGQKTDQIVRDSLVLTTDNSGTPYYVMYLDSHLDEVIREYEENRFIESKPMGTRYTQLRELAKEYPSKKAEIDQFMKSNRKKMSEDSFRDSFNAFIKKIKMDIDIENYLAEHPERTELGGDFCKTLEDKYGRDLVTAYLVDNANL